MMGRNETTGDGYPCLVKRRSQYEYAEHEYENAKAILEELVRLFHSPLKSACGGSLNLEGGIVHSSVLTTLCEIAVVADDKGNEDFHRRLMDAIGTVANVYPKTGRAWDIAETSILRCIDYLDGKDERKYEFSPSDSAWDKKFNDAVFRNRAAAIREVMRLLHSPLPYYNTFDLIRSTIDCLLDMRMNERMQECMEQARRHCMPPCMMTATDMQELERALAGAVDALGKGR